MKHTGIIGRLAHDLRHELAYRITAKRNTDAEILNWLNAMPDVRETLAAHFGGRPVNKQNLSDWKRSAYFLEWRRRQEATDAALRLIHSGADPAKMIPDRHLMEGFATALASQIDQLANAMLTEKFQRERRWQRLCELHRELSQLRGGGDQATRTNQLREP